MEQITMEDLYRLCLTLKKQNYDLKDLPVYLGNDDELNGVHCSWGYQLIDKNNEDDGWLIEMINEDFANNELKDKGVLIS